MAKNNVEVSKIKGLIPYGIIIIVVIIIRTLIATPVNVNGGSMEPTLVGDETMVLNKIELLVNSIERFDIVVIKTDNKRLIKRVIGLPGEVIECSEGYIYIDGKIVKDNYNTGKDTVSFSKVKLADDEYFVLGDNREVSKDSRIIGPIKRKDILGTTKLVIYPFDRIGFVK